MTNRKEPGKTGKTTLLWGRRGEKVGGKLARDGKGKVSFSDADEKVSGIN